RPSGPGHRVVPCRPAARETDRAGRARRRRRPSAECSASTGNKTGTTRGVVGVIGRLEAARIGPGLKIGDGIHHAPAELAKARAAADHALLLQRARWQPRRWSGSGPTAWMG